MGGSVDDNLRRWKEQFTEKPEPVVRKQEAAGGIKATVVELEGTFTGGGAPMAGRAAPPAPGTKLWGAIVELPGSPQPVFFKAWGPARTMERWQPSLEEFLSSLKPSR